MLQDLNFIVDKHAQIKYQILIPTFSYNKITMSLQSNFASYFLVVFSVICSALKLRASATADVMNHGYIVSKDIFHEVLNVEFILQLTIVPHCRLRLHLFLSGFIDCTSVLSRQIQS